MKPKQVLIIENDLALQHGLDELLVIHGFQVCTASNGEQGLRQFYQQPFDLVLLDIMLPQMSGWEVLRQLRRASEIPVIIITALFQQEYIAHIAQASAIYMRKPFSSTALLSCIQIALRPITPPTIATQAPAKLTPVLPEHRSMSQVQSAVSGSSKDYYSDNRLQIDLAKRQVLVEGKRIKLTATEYKLLAYLVRHTNQVLTYQQILDAVWGWEYRNSTHYVHVFVSQLRQKLEENLDKPSYLLTERGVGYFFTAQTNIAVAW